MRHPIIIQFNCSGEVFFVVSRQKNGMVCSSVSFDKKEDADGFVDRAIQNEVIKKEIVREEDIIEFRKTEGVK